MLTDFHGGANQSFALWEQHISSKAWALSVVPHFSLSPPRVTFSRVGWFSCALAFRHSTIPEEKWGTNRSLHQSMDSVVSFSVQNLFLKKWKMVTEMHCSSQNCLLFFLGCRTGEAKISKGYSLPARWVSW